MRKFILWAGLVALAALSLTVRPAVAAEATHRLALQITDNDPVRMSMVLNVAGNVMHHYEEKGETISVQVVAFGPGLNMLRADVSPVKDRLLAFMKEMPGVEFDACNNTLQAMAKKEGKVPPLLPGVVVVPSGAVKLLELSEQGWTVLSP